MRPTTDYRRLYATHSLDLFARTAKRAVSNVSKTDVTKPDASKTISPSPSASSLLFSVPGS